jgi:hypothetical protein
MLQTCNDDILKCSKFLVQTANLKKFPEWISLILVLCTIARIGAPLTKAVEQGSRAHYSAVEAQAK